jgi:hypothetical protein
VVAAIVVDPSPKAFVICSLSQVGVFVITGSRDISQDPSFDPVLESGPSGCLLPPVHFAITLDQLASILAACNDDDLMEAIERIEEAWDKEYLAESDKAWDASIAA